MNPDNAVVIIGAGMAGLTCAVRLKERGISAVVIDQADDVGGKIRTDEHEGFLLDRGFQVLLTAYPETRALLNLEALQLASFRSGALVRAGAKFERLADPRRHPQDLLATAFSSVASIGDKLAVLRLVLRVCGPSLDQVLSHAETTTQQSLTRPGFSTKMIESFFRPFLGGIFLERELATSSRKFEFVFRMFSNGLAALPQGGMRQIPRQLASRLAPQQLRLGQPVRTIKNASVELASGEAIQANQIVMATDVWSAAKFDQQPVTTPPAEVACLYFAATTSPIPERWLVLNGERAGPINNLSVPSDLQPSYAPPGQSLVSVTVLDRSYLDRDDIVDCVRAQLLEWYGPHVKTWRHLRTYRIPRAVAIQTPPALTPVAKPARVSDALIRCGDYLDIVSIEGAVKSGLRAADEVHSRLA